MVPEEGILGGISKLSVAISKAFQGSVAPESKYEKHKRSEQFSAPTVHGWIC